jgi:hypothetical protein
LHGHVVLRHARSGTSSDEIRHERLQRVPRAKPAIDGGGARPGEHRKGAGQCIGALGGIPLRGWFAQMLWASAHAH